MNIKLKYLPILCLTFIIYIIVTGVAIFHHELWSDELHSWNIAKASKSFSDLISNTRYEGHPPLWYSILWIVSQFTHDVNIIQWVQLIIAISIVFLILFFSPFPFVTKLLIPFGYFFLYEYGIFSRNYAIGILCAFFICIILRKDFKYKTQMYYFFLFLLSNTHLLALGLAAGFHIYFLLGFLEKKGKAIVLHILAGIIVLIPSAYFIFPPADSSLGSDFWLQRWNAEQLSSIVKVPVKAFLPIPAWWNFHFWNTEFLVEAQLQWSFLKWIIGILSIALLVFTIKISRKDKNIFLFYMTILFMFFSLSLIIPFSNARQVGFIFIGFLLAYWMISYKHGVSKSQDRFLHILLFVQVIAGIFSVAKEIKYPFSNAFRVKELVNKIPPDNKWVTDYWCLNAVSAYLDTSAYCIDLQEEKSFLQWNSEMKEMLDKPDRYSAGINALYQREDLKNIFFLTIHSPQNIAKIDNFFFNYYELDIVEKIEGAIEKGSNLYLYRVRLK